MQANRYYHMTIKAEKFKDNELGCGHMVIIFKMRKQNSYTEG